jgi:hypothetical protein
MRAASKKGTKQRPETKDVTNFAEIEEKDGLE